MALQIFAAFRHLVPHTGEIYRCVCLWEARGWVVREHVRTCGVFVKYVNNVAVKSRHMHDGIPYPAGVSHRPQT